MRKKLGGHVRTGALRFAVKQLPRDVPIVNPRTLFASSRYGRLSCTLDLVECPDLVGV